jgi:hypothetical protein
MICGVAVPSEIIFPLVELRNGILESSALLRRVTLRKWLLSILMNHRRHALHPSNRLEEDYVSKSLCHLSWSKAMGLTIAIGYHTHVVNRASVGTAYAWYTGVGNKKKRHQKKKNSWGKSPPKR